MKTQCIGHSNSLEKRCQREAVNGLYCQRHLANIPKIVDSETKQRNHNIGHSLYKAGMPKVLINLIRSYDYHVRSTPLKCMRSFNVDNNFYNEISMKIISKDKMITGETNGYLKVWDLTRCVCEKIFKLHESTIRCLETTNDGKVLSYSYDSPTIKIWNPVTFQQIGTVGIIDILTIKTIGTFLTRSGNEKIIISGGTSLQIWDPETSFDPMNTAAAMRGKCEFTFTDLPYNRCFKVIMNGISEYPDIVTYSQNNDQIVIYRYCSYQNIYNISNTLTHALVPGEVWLSDVICKNNRIHSCSTDGRTQTWELMTGTLLSSTPNDIHSHTSIILVSEDHNVSDDYRIIKLGQDGRIINPTNNESRIFCKSNLRNRSYCQAVELPDHRIMTFQDNHFGILDVRDGYYERFDDGNNGDSFAGPPWLGAPGIISSEYGRIISIHMDAKLCMWK